MCVVCFSMRMGEMSPIVGIVMLDSVLVVSHCRDCLCCFLMWSFSTSPEVCLTCHRVFSKMTRLFELVIIRPIVMRSAHHLNCDSIEDETPRFSFSKSHFYWTIKPNLMANGREWNGTSEY